MGYTKRKLPSTILKGILNNCNQLRKSLNRLGINNGFFGLSGALKDVSFISDTELELTCRRANDRVDTVVRIEASLDKDGKAVLVVNRR